MRVLLFHNPTAGSGEEDHGDPEALLGRAGHRVDRRGTAEGIDARGADAYDLVAIAGGDGTVGKAVRALHGTDVPFTILPLGTANNIAASLGIRGKPLSLIGGLPRAVERRLDLACAQGPWGRRVLVEGAGIGGIASALARAKAEHLSGDQKIGAGRTILQGLLRAAAPLRLNASLDGIALPDDLLALEVLRSPVIGPRLCLAPGVQPGNGLHLAYLRPERREAFLDWIAGNPEREPAPIDVIAGERAVFAWSGEALHLDDTYPDPPEGSAAVVVTPAPPPLRVLIPQPEKRA